MFYLIPGLLLLLLHSPIGADGIPRRRPEVPAPDYGEEQGMGQPMFQNVPYESLDPQEPLPQLYDLNGPADGDEDGLVARQIVPANGTDDQTTQAKQYVVKLKGMETLLMGLLIAIPVLFLVSSICALCVWCAYSRKEKKKAAQICQNPVMAQTCPQSATPQPVPVVAVEPDPPQC